MSKGLFYLLPPALLLMGCVSTAKPVSLPDGTRGFAVTCDDGTGSVAECMNRAAKVCGGPYQVHGPSASGGQSAALVPIGTNGASMFALPGPQTILVSCSQ